jgi:hypothetical protein
MEESDRERRKRNAPQQLNSGAAKQASGTIEHFNGQCMTIHNNT